MVPDSVAETPTIQKHITTKIIRRINMAANAIKPKFLSIQKLKRTFIRIRFSLLLNFLLSIVLLLSVGVPTSNIHKKDRVEMIRLNIGTISCNVGIDFFVIF